MNETANPQHDASQCGEASPERTYALVVGIESYDAGPSWDLDGPAKDAALFASWLLDCGVPAAQILLFLSPLPGQPLGVSLPIGLTVRSAQRESVTKAITRTLPGWRGDLFWLFWAGHGVLTRDEHLRLFYSDASVADKRNLELSSLLTALRSDLYAGLPRQIGVVDACQTYAERLQLATTLPADTLPYGQPLPGREQFVLYGASPGQVAVNLGTARAGLFSQMVMEELASLGCDGWPPAMEGVAERLDRRFGELRAAGRADQTPTSFRWRPWTGGERILGEAVPAPAGGTADRAGRPASGAALGEVVSKLLDLDVMADPISRASVLRHLRKGLAASIPYNPATRPHVVNIVTRCLDYPGGLAELVESVRLYADPAAPAFAAAEAAVSRLAIETGQEWPT